VRIIVQRPKIGVFGKRAKYFAAYTGDPTSGPTVQICEGGPTETAAQVRARAIDVLAAAVEQQCLEVRAVTPGDNGRPQDVWILTGNPIVGFGYGRVYAREGTSCATLHSSVILGVSQAPDGRRHALTTMLTHMADYYPESQWPQFLWGDTERGLEAIRTEIRGRNARRAEMTSGASNG
jgi:hypothetical protein